MLIWRCAGLSGASVSIGAVPAHVISASNTRIVCVTPPVPGGSRVVIVSQLGGQQSDGAQSVGYQTCAQGYVAVGTACVKCEHCDLFDDAHLLLDDRSAWHVQFIAYSYAVHL